MPANWKLIVIMDTLIFLLSCLYFFLPAYFANMAPPMAKKAGLLKSLAKPVDGGRKFKGEPLFGDHKTWRGVIAAMIAGIAVVLIQTWLYRFPLFKSLSLVYDYAQPGVYLFAFLMPLGTVMGDIVSAFAKRRLKLKPGAKFLPWDQTNYVLGNLAVVEPVFGFGLAVWLVLFIMTFFLHIIFNRLGYILGLHGAKW